MNNAGRSIAGEDRTRILDAMRRHGPHDFEPLRTTALVQLAWTSALRQSECLALTVSQLVEPRRGGWRIRSSSYLRTTQAKGAKDGRWSSAGQFVVTPMASRALRAYIAEVSSRDWLDLDDDDAPIFRALRLSPNAPSPHGPLSPRGARHCWVTLQRRAGVPRPFYRFHDLRHDSITRFAEACNGDVYKVAKFARCDMRTAARYVHTRFEAVAELAAVAARS